MAENCVRSLHNLLTPRGAQVRNAVAWAGYLYEAIDLFPCLAVGRYGNPG